MVREWGAGNRAAYYRSNSAHGSVKVIAIKKMAREGATLEQVAKTFDNSPKSIRKLLKAKLGSGQWPPLEN